ncbi:MAG: ankyrin repeat domain-containing protein [Gammaproteobacteria bacterium]|nr:ankyrin repeat domain-containing protein [Gammaproteobacteria bacterium]
MQALEWYRKYDETHGARVSTRRGFYKAIRELLEYLEQPQGSQKGLTEKYEKLTRKFMAFLPLSASDESERARMAEKLVAAILVIIRSDKLSNLKAAKENLFKLLLTRSRYKIDWTQPALYGEHRHEVLPFLLGLGASFFPSEREQFFVLHQLMNLFSTQRVGLPVWPVNVMTFLENTYDQEGWLQSCVGAGDKDLSDQSEHWLKLIRAHRALVHSIAVQRHILLKREFIAQFEDVNNELDQLVRVLTMARMYPDQFSDEPQVRRCIDRLGQVQLTDLHALLDMVSRVNSLCKISGRQAPGVDSHPDVSKRAICEAISKIAQYPNKICGFLQLASSLPDLHHPSMDEVIRHFGVLSCERLAAKTHLRDPQTQRIYELGVEFLNPDNITPQKIEEFQRKVDLHRSSRTTEDVFKASSPAEPILPFSERALVSNASAHQKPGLIEAVKRGDVGKVSEILREERSIKIDAQDAQGRTALWWAVYTKHETFVDWLLLFGASLDDPSHGRMPQYRDKLGYTPLDIAQSEFEMALKQRRQHTKIWLLRGKVESGLALSDEVLSLPERFVEARIFLQLYPLASMSSRMIKEYQEHREETLERLNVSSLIPAGLSVLNTTAMVIHHAMIKYVRENPDCEKASSYLALETLHRTLQYWALRIRLNSLYNAVDSDFDKAKIRAFDANLDVFLKSGTKLKSILFDLISEARARGALPSRALPAIGWPARDTLEYRVLSKIEEKEQEYRVKYQKTQPRAAVALGAREKAKAPAAVSTFSNG